mgnify:CR=1 FL=1
MANRFNGKIIVIDTTDTQVGGPDATSGVTGPLSIKLRKWVGTQNSGKNIAQDDDLNILWKDANGDSVIECRAQEVTPDQEAYSVSFCQPWIVPGLYVEDLDGGELQIFLA